MPLEVTRSYKGRQGVFLLDVDCETYSLEDAVLIATFNKKLHNADVIANELAESPRKIWELRQEIQELQKRLDREANRAHCWEKAAKEIATKHSPKERR